MITRLQTPACFGPSRHASLPLVGPLAAARALHVQQDGTTAEGGFVACLVGLGGVLPVGHARILPSIVVPAKARIHGWRKRWGTYGGIPRGQAATPVLLSMAQCGHVVRLRARSGRGGEASFLDWPEGSRSGILRAAGSTVQKGNHGNTGKQPHGTQGYWWLLVRRRPVRGSGPITRCGRLPLLAMPPHQRPFRGLHGDARGRSGTDRGGGSALVSVF